ncbi:hypothetical protein [Salinimicrobium soli]|uniref:hypothetical protein n=1 Tax=Salinimicrobium soli TaxID=1254399 RepID=UPI003AB01F05
MRKSLILYLFVFTALLAIFMYVSGSRMLDAKEDKVAALEEELLQANKNTDSIYSEYRNAASFSLASNEEALSYLENRGFDPAEVNAKVEDAIISRNRPDADNELVPYEGMEGFFRINKVKLLNHKWAIASFTDGAYWGDLFISYEILDNGTLELNTEKAVLYPRN